MSAGFISLVVFACSLRVPSTKTCNGLSRILPSVTKKKYLVLEINAEDECKCSAQTVLDASAEQLTPLTLRRSDVGAADFHVRLLIFTVPLGEMIIQRSSFRLGGGASIKTTGRPTLQLMAAAGGTTSVFVPFITLNELERVLNVQPSGQI